VRHDRGAGHADRRGDLPNLVPSTLDPAWNLTIYNARSSHKTLGIMLTIALIGMPFVLAYSTTIQWVFRGKVRLDHSSY
jgi:cytochrome d ubiquinol oxidase subunit II